MIAEIVDTDDGERIHCSIEFYEKDALKLVGGARWSGDRWTVPLSWASCKQLRGVFGDRLTSGPRLTEWAWSQWNERVNPALQLRFAQDWQGDADDYPFQRAGIEFLVVAGSALLCDDLGTGKTRQSVKAVRANHDLGRQPWPALVVAPSSVKIMWQREFERHCPGIHTFVIGGGATKRVKALAEARALVEQGYPVVVIINWESVRIHSRLAPYGSINLQRCQNCDSESERKPSQCHRCPKELNKIPWGTVIVDEAHRAKDPTSQATRAIWATAHQSSVRFRYALTGTPIANHVGDAWSLLHLVDPVEWPSRTRCNERYALLTFNAFGGMEIAGINPVTREEYFSIVDPRMRRMPKELVLPHLPPKISVIRYVEMSAKQAKAYKQMKDTMLAELDTWEDHDDQEIVTDTDMLLATNPLARMTRLMQFSSAYAEMQEDGSVSLTAPSCKIDELEAIAGELGQEPFVVCAPSRQLVELACERLTKLKVPWTRIVGGMSDEHRQQAIDDFQSGRVQVMLFTTKAGGIGITLTRAGYLVRLQRSWSMVDDRQAEGRVHRIGSEVHDKIVIIDVIATETVEEAQVQAIEGKAEHLESFLRDRQLLKALLDR